MVCGEAASTVIAYLVSDHGHACLPYPPSQSLEAGAAFS